MNYFFRLLLSILLISLCRAALNSGLPKHSFSNPPALPFWTALGSTHYDSNAIRLTPDRQSHKGAIWNSEPLRAMNFEIIFDVRVYGQGALGADGLAFWLTAERGDVGPMFGNVNKWKGLGVILDTYDNDGAGEHPYLMTLINDGTKAWEQSPNHDHSHHQMELGGCRYSIRKNPSPSSIKITFKQGVLSVHTDAQRTGTWTLCSTATTTERFYGYFIGFSAATGQLADNHEIHSIVVNSLDADSTGAPSHVDNTALFAGAISRLEYTIGKVSGSDQSATLNEIKNALRDITDILSHQSGNSAPAQAGGSYPSGQQQTILSHLVTLEAQVKDYHNKEVLELRNVLNSMVNVCQSQTGRKVDTQTDYLPWVLVVLLTLTVAGMGFHIFTSQPSSSKKLW